MLAIYKKELRSYFHSFVGPLFIGVTLFLFGIYFTAYDLFMGYPYIGYALSAVIFLFFFSVPILSMRILAEERKQKTDQFLLTAPVRVWDIVLGKFYALATLLLIPVAIISIYPLVLSAFGEISFAETYLALGAFFLYGLACIAIGEFVSSITESQMIAAIVSFGFLFVGYVMNAICNMISSTGNWLTKILSVFDMSGRFDELMDGSLSLSSCVYFLSIILLFLVFTEQSIQKRRYHVSKKNFSLSAYSSTVIAGSIAVAVILNLIVAELPSRYTVFDLTANRLYSLTDDTKELVSNIGEDVTIYVLANENQADSTLANTLDSYEGLSSHIKVTYVDPAVNPKFYTKYTDGSISSNSVIVESSKRSRVVDYNDLYVSELDYSTYSQNVTGYDAEGQITSAISYVLSENMPKIYMVTGHGELELDSTFTDVIQKANIDTETINLMDYDAVPEDAEAVFVNAPTEDLSSDDAEKLLTYLNNGGDIFINTTYTGKDMPNFDKLLDFYGVQVSKGLIIETAQNSYYQDPFYLLPSIEYDTITSDIYSGNSYVFAPYCQGLTFTEKEDVEVTPLLASSEKSYVRDDIENSTSYDRQDGDEDGPFYIGLSCTAQVAGAASQEQETDESGNTDAASGDVKNSESTAIIFSCENLFTQEADTMVAGTNQKLFSGVLQAFETEDGESSSVVIPVKNYEVEYLTVSQSWISILALITVIVIPFGFLITGFVIWFRRRKL